MNTLTVFLTAIFGTGAAGVILAIARGTDVWRSGSQRSEARSLRTVERTAAATERRLQESEKRSDYRQDLVDYWRGVAGEREYVIITRLGREAVPALPPPPKPPIEIPQSEEDRLLLDEAKRNE